MPDISVIVCTYNRDKYIYKALDHLRNQSAPKLDFEVLIVDNKSADNTASICHDFLKESDTSNFHYFLETKQGHTFARNRGIQESIAEILAFIDDDAFVDVDYIENLKIQYQKNPQMIASGGKIVPVYESGQEPKWMSKYLLPLVAALDMGDELKPFKKSKFPIGANMAFRKEVFKKYGVFDEELGRRGDQLEGGDEKEVFQRLNNDDLLILYLPSVKVDHIIPKKRVQLPYVKGLALGVGTSERRRLRGTSISSGFNKIISELIKIAGLFILFFLYLFKFKPAAAVMLIRFRFWVLKGLFQ